MTQLTPRAIVIANIVLVLAAGGNLRAGDELDLPLDELLNTRISTAAKYDQQMSEVAASVTVIGSEEIQRYGWTTFDELLGAIRGLYVTNDRNFSSLGVRGISRPTDSNIRLLVLIDGNPLVGTPYGDSPTGNSLSISLHSIDRVEFVRGPGSALYGTGAMFGVINVITKKGNELAGVSGDLTVGSDERYHGSLQFGRSLESGLTIAATTNWSTSQGTDLYYPEYDSPDTNNGLAVGRDSEEFGSAMVTMAYGPLKLWGRTQTRRKSIPTGSYETNFNEFSETENRSQILGLDYAKKVGSDKQFDVRTYWLRHTGTGVYPYEDAGLERSEGLRYGAEGRFRWDIRANQRLVVGAEMGRAPVAAYQYIVGDYKIELDRPFSVASLYLQHEYQPFRKVSVVTGIRHDKYSTGKGSTNPRLAIIVNPEPKTSFKILYGSAFRVPSIYELEYEDQVWGAKRNRELSAERVRSLEAVMERRLTEATFIVFSAYRVDASDLIEATVDAADSLVQFQNGGSAKGSGLEIEMNMRRKKGLWAYGSYSTQEMREDGQWMTNSPRHLMRGGLSTNPWAVIHGGVEVAYESGRRTLQDTITNASTLVHGTVSARIAPRTRMILSVRNVFDAEFANAVGPEFRQAAIEQDGRTFAVSLSVSQ